MYNLQKGRDDPDGDNAWLECQAIIVQYEDNQIQASDLYLDLKHASICCVMLFNILT